MPLETPARPRLIPDRDWQPSGNYAKLEIAALRKTLKKLDKQLDQGAYLPAGQVRLIVQTNATLAHDRAVVDEEVVEMVLSAIQTLVDSLGPAARGDQPGTPRDHLVIALEKWAYREANPLRESA